MLSQIEIVGIILSFIVVLGIMLGVPVSSNKATIGETFWYKDVRYCYVVLTGSDYLIDRYYSDCNFQKGEVLPEGRGLGKFCVSDPRKNDAYCNLYGG